MTPEQEQTLREVHGMANQIMGSLSGVTATQKEHGELIRTNSDASVEHRVKIDHLERNFDGLAQKQRRHESVPHMWTSTGEKAHTGFWAEFFSELFEKKTLAVLVTLLGAGSLVSIYNFVVSSLHRLPTLPIPGK